MKRTTESRFYQHSSLAASTQSPRGLLAPTAPVLSGLGVSIAAQPAAITTVALKVALRCVLIVLAGILLVTAFTSPASATIHFGVRCEETFQNNWLPTISVYDGCSDLIGNVESAGYPVDFYFNLVGAQTDFYYGDGGETCDSCGGVDSVDFFFMATHGGIATGESLADIVTPAPGDKAKVAGYGMWNNDVVAWTPQMRIGDSGRQAKALSTFSCDTLYNNDGLLPTRWGKAFAGGLKILTGGHDLLWTGDDDDAMSDFSNYMVEGNSIGSSWLVALYNDNNDNNPAVANTGTNSSNCWSRQGVGLSGLMSESVLRDSKIGYYCWTNVSQ